jgi:hypothetical protein
MEWVNSKLVVPLQSRKIDGSGVGIYYSKGTRVGGLE